jgi:alpha-L-glutamate ligase-like protein
MDSPNVKGARSRKLRGKVRTHLPFLLFILVFGAYCVYLQFELTAALQRLFLTRIFFQVAVAALVIAVMKNVVGIRTLGLFAPAIIALAFLATGLPLGLALLGLILGIVVLTRGAIMREKVQEAHRVAILVTIVSITIASIAIIGLEFQQHQLFFAVLFPVLISGWIGERYVEQVDRVGWEEPSKELGWTIAAVIVSFIVIIQDPLINFVMFNPLTWLLLVVLNWMFGTRVHFRLSERFRFGGVRRYFLGDSPVEGDFAGDVLTMTVRNREFVARYNPPGLMARLGKDEVKALLLPLGVPIARTYLVLRERLDLGSFKSWLVDHDKFALKPSSSYGGEGILLVRGKNSDTFATNMGPMSAAAIETHASSIIEGEFHGGRRDTAVVEELLVQQESLKDIAPLGLADFRVICFQGYPVMAMIRIPTEASGGKANIHMGAVAAGLRISSGTILHSVWRGGPQPYHPDTGEPLLGRQIPFWDDILEVAAEAQRLTGLGFAGVDVTLDAGRGAVIMEVNRRPGLEIQNANAAGLLRRLRMIEGLPRQEGPVEDRLNTVNRLDEENWGIKTTTHTERTPSADQLDSGRDLDSNRTSVGA